MSLNSLVRRFPAELIDLVIRETDLPTLPACALVCHAFLPSSQSSIFSEIELVPSSSRSTQLYDVLSRSPHLRGYVRTLEIVDVQSGDWASWCHGLVGVLGLLDDVHSFTLVFGTERSTCIHWTGLLQEVRTAICMACQRWTLISLRLENLGDFTDSAEFSQLIASPTLRHLRLLKVDLPAGEIVFPHRPKLAQCSLGLSGPTLKSLTTWLVDGGCLSSTRRLDFLFLWLELLSGGGDTSVVVTQLQKLLEASSNIETLRLFALPPRALSWLRSPSSLPQFKRLRVVVLRMMNDNGQSTKLLASMFESFGRDLMTVELGFDHMLKYPQTIGWEPLKHIITTENFPRLEKLVVDIGERLLDLDAFGSLANFEPSGPLPNFEEETRAALPDLYQRGILQFKDLQPTVLRMRAADQ